MQISETVTITIEVDDDNATKCDLNCPQCVDGFRCHRYDWYLWDYNCKRSPSCLAEFGTGEKPNVVSSEESKIGDTIELGGKLVVLRYGIDPRTEDVCAKI